MFPAVGCAGGLPILEEGFSLECTTLSTGMSLRHECDAMDALNAGNVLPGVSQAVFVTSDCSVDPAQATRELIAGGSTMTPCVELPGGRSQAIDCRTFFALLSSSASSVLGSFALAAALLLLLAE